MGQNEYIELAIKRKGKRFDFEEKQIHNCKGKLLAREKKSGNEIVKIENKVKIWPPFKIL